MFIGTIARRPCAGSASPRASSSSRRPLAVIVERDVVDRAAERALDLSHVRELHAHHLEAPARPDRLVEARRRRRVQLVADEHLDRGARRGERLARVQHPVHAHLRELAERFGGHEARPRPAPGGASGAGSVRPCFAGCAGAVPAPSPSPAPRAFAPRFRLVMRRAPRSAGGSGEASRIRWPTSTEPTPSTMQWWVFVASAQPPPSRPSTIDHLPQRAVAVEPLREEAGGPVLQLPRRRPVRAAPPA